MSSPTSLLPEPQRLGDFVIVREIGRGGMGVVYEAQQSSLNRRVALKVLSSNMGLAPTAVQRFRSEAEAAAKLHHTNIVPVYATGEANGTHFYAMELIEGPSLDHVIRQLKLPPSNSAGAPSSENIGKTDTSLDATGPYIQASGSSVFTPTSSSLSSGSGYFDTVARMIAEVADALNYSHQQGVIHRDIKPSNLLLSPAGRLSVNDFGLARLLEQPGMTITGEMVGTPRYMSPEQIAAGRIPVDHRTDIYSLGATLYELLTLQPPFVAERRDQILTQVMQSDPRPPRKVNPKVPVDLETICLKAMDKDPNRRYETASQMADDLRRYVNRFAILARRVSPITRLKKWAQRNPALSAALSGVLLCAGVAGGLAYRANRLNIERAEAESKHIADVLEEKRRSTLEMAIMMAYLQDFDEANKAIHEAEDLGCSPGQLRILRGQLALYQGQIDEAIEHLKRACELLPDNGAAQSMLAVAYANAGRSGDYYKSLGDALRLTPVTAEDFLFRGHAEALTVPERGLISLDEAVRRRPSTLAHMIRTDTLRFDVLGRPDIEKAKSIMATVEVLKQQFPGNAMVLSLSITVHTACFHVFGLLQQSELQQKARDEGLRDARALEQFGKSSKAVNDRWAFLDEIGEPEAAVDDLRRFCNETKDMNSVFHYVQYLHKRGDFEQAVKVGELCKGTVLLDLIRVVSLAELKPDGWARANKLYDETARGDLRDWELFNSQMILRFLGRKKEAIEVSRKFLSQPDLLPPLAKDQCQQALEYCANQRSADELIAVTKYHNERLCNAHFCIALTALADGDRATARKHFELSEMTRFYEALPYTLSQMILSRMQKDPTWPPWIPPSK